MIGYLSCHRVDAALLAVCVLAIALAFLFSGDPGRCAISQNEAMPWVQEQRAGCPEALP